MFSNTCAMTLAQKSDRILAQTRGLSGATPNATQLIEELRSALEENMKEVQRLRKENATLTAERDEARREVCGLLVACHTDPDDEKPDPNLKNVHAGIRGWDCFKDNP